MGTKLKQEVERVTVTGQIEGGLRQAMEVILNRPESDQTETKPNKELKVVTGTDQIGTALNKELEATVAPGTRKRALSGLHDTLHKGIVKGI